MKYHWSKSGKGEKIVNLSFLMRSDKIVITAIKNTSTTFGVRGRVECAYY